jgi:hypothetical protein
MGKASIIDRISRGRTDLVFELLRLPDWRDAHHEGPVRVLQWFVYYGDVSALKAVLEAGGDMGSLDLNTELGHVAFFGQWKVCDFLLKHGDSPLSWASEHLRPGAILALLAHGPFTISDASRRAITSDHGAGWGNGMERNLLGEYLGESTSC